MQSVIALNIMHNITSNDNILCNKIRFTESSNNPYLSLESMVLLGEIFFSIMIRVSPSVPPFKCFMCWNIYVLEMVIPPI